MRCVKCLSKEARVCKIRGFQWLWSPFCVTVRCNRCLSTYYYPGLFVLLSAVIRLPNGYKR